MPDTFIKMLLELEVQKRILNVWHIRAWFVPIHSVRADTGIILAQ